MLGTLLQLSARLATQLRQFFHIRHILFQQGDALVCLLQRPILGGKIISGSRRARLGSGLGFIHFGQLELILGWLCRSRRLFIRRCTNLATGLPPGIGSGWRVRDDCTQLASVFAVFGTLCRHQATCIRRRHSQRRLAIWQIQNPPGTQAIHVSAIKRIGIAAIQRSEHLLHRDAFRLVLLGDGTQRIAPANRIRCSRCRLGSGRIRNRLFLGACTRLGSPFNDARCFGCARRGRLLNGRRNARLNRRSNGIAAVVLGGVQQEGVLANQAATCPAQFNEHVEERFIHRLDGSQRHNRLTRSGLHRKLDLKQCTIELDIGLPERVRRRQSRRQGVSLIGLQ